jgi:hypothetical protein
MFTRQIPADSFSFVAARVSQLRGKLRNLRTRHPTWTKARHRQRHTENHAHCPRRSRSDRRHEPSGSREGDAHKRRAGAGARSSQGFVRTTWYAVAYRESEACPHRHSSNGDLSAPDPLELAQRVPLSERVESARFVRLFGSIHGCSTRRESRSEHLVSGKLWRWPSTWSPSGKT